MPDPPVRPDVMRNGVSHWRRLICLRERSPISARLVMHRPAPEPPDPNIFTELLGLSDGAAETRLIWRHLLTALACPEHDAVQVRDLVAGSVIRDLFPESDPDVFFSAHWISIPLTVLQGGMGRVVHLMLGLIPGCGELRLLDPAALHESVGEILSKAVSLPGVAGQAEGHDLLVWSLRDDEESPLHGNSLMLPFALGLYLAGQKRTWPTGLFASASCDGDGRLVPATGIEEKYAAVRGEAGLFLAAAERVISRPERSRLIRLPTLEAALFALDWFDRGIDDGGTVLKMYGALRDAGTFLSSFERLPPLFFQIHDLENVRRKIRQQSGLYFPRAAEILHRHFHDGRRVEVISGLYSREEVIALLEEQPAACLQWCLGSVSYCNGRGLAGEARKWADTARRVVARFPGLAVGDDLVNHNFVTVQQDRYAFRLPPPPEFTSRLEQLEQIHALTGEDNYQLGAMYGTLAQWHGFHGPEHLTLLREAAAKARDAFGVSFAGERPRLCNYLLYGLLDAGRWEEAEGVLPAYLGLIETADPREWFTVVKTSGADDRDGPYRLALCCRFAADHPDFPVPGIREWGISLIPSALAGQHHPWQLTALNLGRLLWRESLHEDGARLWRHSAAVCRRHGITMTIMGLLALAELHRHGLATGDEYEEAETIVQRIERGEDDIDQSHFAALIHPQEGTAILGKVARTRHLLFPFSFR